MMTHVGMISEVAPCVTLEAKCGDVDLIFKENKHAQGVVVIDVHTPIALIMRNAFYKRWVPYMAITF